VVGDSVEPQLRAPTTLLTELVEVQLPSFDPSTGAGQAGVVGDSVEPQLRAPTTLLTELVSVTELVEVVEVVEVVEAIKPHTII
jgi:hypothetical protein